MKLNFLWSFILLTIPLSSSSIDLKRYYDEIKNTNEDVTSETSNYVYDKIMKRTLNSTESNTGIQFGVHGMEIPAVKYGVDSDKVDKAFELLARAGVDSLRSSETTWHRVADENGDPTNYKEVDFQLQQAKKYGLSHLFVIGYPPPKFTVSGNKLSAVSSRYYDKYQNYLDETFKHFNGYNVKYVELGNEVDAPKTWWINSTPQMYIKEMSMLKKTADGSNQRIKTVAFSATYSRSPNKGGADGGRNFVRKSFELGIDKYSDAYSIHHFVFGADDLPGYIRSEMIKHEAGNKPLLDTEQLDTSAAGSGRKQNPYDIVKLFARAFFFYNMKRMDYYLAQDRYLNNKLYYIGLFDAQWRPKIRLLAYSMAVDSMKNKKLVYFAKPADNVEAYVLESTLSNQPKGQKYTILMWLNSNKKDDHKIISGIKGKVYIEHWNLDIETKENIYSGYKLDNKPVAVFSDEKPDWKPVDKNDFISKNKMSAISYSPMPTD